MNLTRLLSRLFLLGLLPFAGCSSDDEEENPYPGDSTAAIRSRCEAELTGARECDSNCILEQLNLDCPEGEGLFEHPEISDYTQCLMNCPDARSCTERERTFPECDCAVRCATSRSERLQGLLAFDADCERDQAGPICN